MEDQVFNILVGVPILAWWGYNGLISSGVIGEEAEGSKFGIRGVHGEEPGNVYVNCICIIFWVNCILMFEKILELATTFMLLIQGLSICYEW